MDANKGEWLAVTGDTYPHKDALKKMGAKWDGDNKRWMVKAETVSGLPDGLSVLTQQGQHTETLRKLRELKSNSAGISDTIDHDLESRGKPVLSEIYNRLYAISIPEPDDPRQAEEVLKKVQSGGWRGYWKSRPKEEIDRMTAIAKERIGEDPKAFVAKMKAKLASYPDETRRQIVRGGKIYVDMVIDPILRGEA